MSVSVRRFRRLLLTYVLGFWSLITLLVVSSVPAYAEWVEVAESGKSTNYADLETIRRNGNFGKMWVLYDIKAIKNYKGKSYLSLKAQVEYNCTEEQVRTLVEYRYSGQMGTG